MVDHWLPAVPFWERQVLLRCHAWTQPLADPMAVRLSKNSGYLRDKLYRVILSDMKELDQEEKKGAGRRIVSQIGHEEPVCATLVQ